MQATATRDWIAELAQTHLDAAYNLGRWLLGNEQDAADAVHDAYLRAARSAHTYADGNPRAWWLAIVRNCCIARINARRRDAMHRTTTVAVDELKPDQYEIRDAAEEALRAERQSLVERHLRALAPEFREALVLREIEDLSYREIADVLQVPIGTVMSRLSRARAMLQRALAPATREDAAHGL
ncbi:MAG TPA: sigma-70 family RNA polymerase sigma factor [Rhodanobacteraceae bacterium]|jgi:RNA polymerase sigma-70 factor (ECF subfamily)|nr:sigma-70 family RNA polymerase sigma factor [Rhodanobacteraceae bacterium]